MRRRARRHSGDHGRGQSRHDHQRRCARSTDRAAAATDRRAGPGGFAPTRSICPRAGQRRGLHPRLVAGRGRLLIRRAASTWPPGRSARIAGPPAPHPAPQPARPPLSWPSSPPPTRSTATRSRPGSRGGHVHHGARAVVGRARRRRRHARVGRGAAAPPPAPRRRGRRVVRGVDAAGDQRGRSCRRGPQRPPGSPASPASPAGPAGTTSRPADGWWRSPHGPHPQDARREHRAEDPR